MVEKYLTKADLRKKVGCPGYVIDYLNDCGRLPVVKESKGQGYPRFYDPKAIEVIKQHFAKGIK